MKTLKIFSIALICSVISTSLIAQAKTETFKVSGECGMCEKKIEKAAKAAGASYADWNKDTKVITVKFNSSTSNLAKIQQSIADAGYDNVGAKASSEAYDKLDDCCKYDRTTTAKKACCDKEDCSKENCAGKDCCKDAGGKTDCCKKPEEHHH